ncbi:MAG: arginine--tRNA ligase [Bordetella sp.]|nr:MAG: arginine--tRNA ligase [Bordetella sp.]
MLIKQKKELENSIRNVISNLFPNIEIPPIFLERPKIKMHGDISTNIAMQIAKSLKINPLIVANDIRNLLISNYQFNSSFEKIEVAKPGFINFQLSLTAKLLVINLIEEENFSYGYFPKIGKKILIEFVSANPTGPLHVGHARQAAIGDTICNLYKAIGWDVTKEFYFNDSGNQIYKLAKSVQARAKGIMPDSDDYPLDGYKGNYINDIAIDFMNKKTIEINNGSIVSSTGNIEDLNNIQEFSVAYMRHEQDQDLKNFGIIFDNYYMESDLYSVGYVEKTVQTIIKNGYTYELDGALWLKTTQLGTGDDKDRVMRKSQGGGYTYFVPDVAYHQNKWDRGFQYAINIQGSDHYGTVARVKAGLKALNRKIPSEYPFYILHKMVKVLQNGQELKVSKRAGNYVTMNHLINLVGHDAARYFLVQRKADTEFVFDINLALSKSDENPVYYIQYAYARICSLINKSNISNEKIKSGDIYLLSTPSEFLLLQRLSEFQQIVMQAAEDLSPHKITSWLRNCASDFHVWYNSEKILDDNESLMLARLRLAQAAKQVLFNGLSLIGVSAPEKM